MKEYVLLLPVVCACIVAPACATHPVSARTGADAAAAMEDKTLTNDEVRRLIAQGYKPVGRDGEVYYCRSDMPTGSRVASVSCKTAEQMKQIQEASKDMLTQSQKTGGCRSGQQSCAP
jgi:hypothetical protein